MFLLSLRVSSFTFLPHRFTQLLTLESLELLEAVRASLRAKVSALVEDKWMYEKEEEPRPA